MLRKAMWLLLAASAVQAQNYKPEAVAQANRGLAEARKENYPAAIRAYKTALAIEPQLPGLYLNLGLAYFKSGDFSNALTALTKASAQNATSQTVTLLAMCEFGLGHYREAASRLRPLVTAQPDNQELAYTLARALLMSGQNQDALELFRAMLQRDPDAAPVHMLLGQALDASYQPDAAVTEFETAAKRAPGLPDVHFGLGYLYWKQNRFEEAEAEFRAELKNDPKHAKAAAYLGDTLMKAGHTPDAIEQLTGASRLDNNILIAHFDLAVLYTADKQYAEALTEFRQAIRIAPADYAAHYRLARLYQLLGKSGEATTEFAIVQKLHEKSEEASLLKLDAEKPGTEKTPPAHK